MEDDRIVISSGVALTPEAVASRTFATSFRGFDQGEVRNFLKRLADELAMLAEREQELRQSLQDALTRAAHPDLDAETLTVALGEHAARLLTNAREAATNIVAEAETRAARIMGEAETKIARVRAEADGLLARRSEEAERLTAGVRQAAEADVRALRERARAEAEAEVESARAQGREMVGEARALRERMLADLTRRRRTAEVHIEQLRLARQRLLEAYGVVRRTLDEATAELNAAEAEARPNLVAAASGPLPTDDDPAGGGAVPRSPDPASASGSAPSRPLAAVPPPSDVAGPVVRELARATGGGARGPAGNGTLAAVHTAPPAPPAPVPPTPAPAEQAPPAEPTDREARVRSRARREPPPEPPPGPAPVPTPPPTEAHDAALAPAPIESPPATDAPVDAPLAEAPASAPADTPPAPSTDENRPPPSARVDELFARIRAAQPGPGEPETEPAEGGPVTPPPEEAPTANGQGSHDVAAAPPGAVADEAALFRRDELLDPLDADLTRQLKRVLQDEQNEVLDRLRRQRRPTPEAVLPDARSHAARYQAVAHPVLAEAARRGVEWVAGAGEGRGPAPAVVERWAAEMAVELVGPLRERLERALRDADGGPDADTGDEEGAGSGDTVAERLSASYRQWKIEQVEPAVRHHMVTAFCRGAFAATPDDGHLRWIVDDEGPCPDCDDNVLAGAVAKGQAFPTGQVHPPAHVGCRCLLVPADPS